MIHPLRDGGAGNVGIKGSQCCHYFKEYVWEVEIIVYFVVEGHSYSDGYPRMKFGIYVLVVISKAETLKNW